MATSAMAETDYGDSSKTSRFSSSSSTSSSSSSSSSPIMNISPDHVFAILLVLPIDSILSFAMTCKRFWFLTSSDSLWEAICRREWGPTSVDTLKSNNQQLPWMRIYKHVSQLDSISCHKLEISPPETESESVVPSPRASHSLTFVSDCLVLFGGGCEGGRHLDDTWVAYIGNEFLRMIKWQKVESGVPSGRFGHTCVVIGHHLVLFGGINDSGIRQYDTWIGQLVSNENLCSISLSWRLLKIQSLAPPARGAHAACCTDQRKMVIHGGIGQYGVRLGDTWILELDENLCFGSWHELVFHPSPPPRSGHSLTYINGTKLVLFGGRGLGYDVLNDVWVLHISDETNPKWVQILYELQNIQEGLSLPRVGHSATLILGGRVLIHGGEDSYRHRKDDFWMLDISCIRTNMWRRLKTKGYKSNSRSFHRACADHSGHYLYVFGGMVDGLLHPPEASGLRFDGELFLVELGTML